MIPEKLYSCDLVLLMPCFSAGAYQTEPELRPATFRGELRWWFRCLGGTREQESAVFGSTSPSAQASAVALQVTDISQPSVDYNWTLERPSNDNKRVNSAYITYMLGANKSVDRTKAFLPPGLHFKLSLIQRRPISEQNKALLHTAWKCLCHLGAVGYRKTRALGAYAPLEASHNAIEEILQHPTFKQHFNAVFSQHEHLGDYLNKNVTTSILTICAQLLKSYRNKNGLFANTGRKFNNLPKGVYFGPSALGNAIKGRQTSAVRFRPVLNDGKLQLLILKAPDITLSEEAAKHNMKL